jgi:hypothetical protein
MSVPDVPYGGRCESRSVLVTSAAESDGAAFRRTCEYPANIPRTPAIVAVHRHSHNKLTWYSCS